MASDYISKLAMTTKKLSLTEDLMLAEYYNYGLAKDVQSKLKDGMYSGGYQFTSNVYFSAHQAGRELGVDPLNIDTVLKFAGDIQFKKGPNVSPVPSRGFIGGATQFEHPGRPKPIAQRKIGEQNWTPL